MRFLSKNITLLEDNKVCYEITFIKNVFLWKREKNIEGKFKTGSLESPLAWSKIVM